MTSTIKMFIKFGSEENIVDMFENGTIYLNPIQYFRKIEGDELRGDSYEGATRIVNSLPGTFRIHEIDREIPYIKAQYIVTYPEVLGNIYSLYCISSFHISNPFKFKIDKRILRFGTHCLMIKDNAYFYDRILGEFKSQGLKFHHGFVKYYDKETVCKDLTVFEKPSIFEYQNEFRFYVENQEISPIKMQIGSLKDYAEVFPLKKNMSLRLAQKNHFA